MLNWDGHERAQRSTSGSRDEGTKDLTHTTRWANFRNKEPAVRNPAAGAPRPRPREHSSARLQSGHYPELGYQHEGHHRLSPYAKEPGPNRPRN